MTDFSELLTPTSHETGLEVEIVNPATLEGMGVFIKLAGVGSRRFREAKSKASQYTIDKKDAGEKVDLHEVQVQMLAGLTIDWRGVKDGEKDLKFSPEKCAELYSGSDFVFDQCSNFVNNRGNFTKG